jgi:ABC-2 type transporter
MDIFVRERHIFVRETGSKYYTAFSYFLAKIVLDMFLLRVIPVAIFTFVFYFLMGLKNELEAFVTFLATIILFNICAGIMSICISIATPTVGQANLIAAVWFLVMLLFGGFLVNIQSMSAWFAWLKYLSIFYYSFEILMTNELSGQVLSFDAPGYPSIPVYGEVFLKTIGMDAGNQTRNMACLCTLALGFGVVAYFLLLTRVPPSAAVLFNKMEKENRRLALALTKKLSLHNVSSEQFTHPEKSTKLHASQRDMTDPVIVTQSSMHSSSWETVEKDLVPLNLIGCNHRVLGE